MERFDAKVAIVTGAAGQIGSACVEALAAEGAKVGAVDVVESPTSSRNVVSVVADLKYESEITRSYRVIEEQLGPVDILIQSAAVIARTPFLETTGDIIDHVFGVNVRAILLGGRVAAQSMIERGATDATIVNLSSIAGLVSDARAVAYQASKAAVTMATRGMAVALAPYGIRVNAVDPGSMAKPQEDEPRDPTDLSDYERMRIPLGRHGVGTEIAEAVLFLASAKASFVTGTTLYVDGGTLARF